MSYPLADPIELEERLDGNRDVVVVVVAWSDHLDVALTDDLGLCGTSLHGNAPMLASCLTIKRSYGRGCAFRLALLVAHGSL